MSAFHREPGRRVTFTCPANVDIEFTSARLYGTDVYTDASPVCAAALHAGVLQAGRAGIVTVVMTEGADTFPASTRNGVTSRDYGAYPSGYRIDVSGDPGQLDWSTTGAGIPEEITSTIPLWCPGGGSITYPIWGTDVYTDHSSICFAAVHYGVITRVEGGRIGFTRMPGQDAYPASSRNGVESSAVVNRRTQSFRVGPPPGTPVTVVLVEPQTGTITPMAPEPPERLTERAPVSPSLEPTPMPVPTDTILTERPLVPTREELTPVAMQVGTGISDITGPVAEVGMMGYGDTDQYAMGLHMRLYARAFAFADPASGKRVMFVSAELGQLFGGIKEGVLKQLPAAVRARYDDENLMISATHTHAGPGGYSHWVMYNLTTLGHVRQSYEAIVAGITEAIVQADASLGTGTVNMAVGRLDEYASVNRSEVAFILNPEFQGPRAALPPGAYLPEPNTVEPVIWEMTVLGLQRGGRPIGSISWFPVHNTSLTKTNLLISSDHKGYAAYLMERLHGTVAPFRAPGAYVAAFPNGSEGDLSPNIAPGFRGPAYDGVNLNEFRSMEMIGEREYANANRLLTGTAQTPVVGEIDFRQKFVRMPGLAVTSTSNRNGAGGNTLCVAAYGMSFMAGAEDGPTGMLAEGLSLTNMTNAMRAQAQNAFSSRLPPLLGEIVMGAYQAANDPCQYPKPVLIRTGALANWTPEVLPFQLLRLGNVVIAGVPGEMTTQAGRRLQQRILTALEPAGVVRVIITGLANEYSGYVTTPEEYDSQQYEGASTLYGRLTLDAYLQIFGELAATMAAGIDVPPGDVPPEMTLIPQIELTTPVIFDSTLPGQEFGQVLIQPPETMARNGVVVATFRSGHPKNDLRRTDTFFRIERDLGAGSWELVAWDAMPETMLVWSRPPAGGGLSAIEVRWHVPLDAEPGTYRMRLFGKAKKDALSPVLTDYEGTTRTFLVN